MWWSRTRKRLTSSNQRGMCIRHSRLLFRYSCLIIASSRAVSRSSSTARRLSAYDSFSTCWLRTMMTLLSSLSPTRPSLRSYWAKCSSRPIAPKRKRRRKSPTWTDRLTSRSFCYSAFSTARAPTRLSVSDSGTSFSSLVWIKSAGKIKS